MPKENLLMIMEEVIVKVKMIKIMSKRMRIMTAMTMMTKKMMTITVTIVSNMTIMQGMVLEMEMSPIMLKTTKNTASIQKN